MADVEQRPDDTAVERERRGRLLPIVLTVLLLLAVGAGVAWWLDQRSEQRARVAAANAQVRAELQDRYEAMEAAATDGADAAASLRLTLQEHLTVSDRSDRELSDDRLEEQAALTAAGERLADLASQPPPTVPEEADEDALEEELATYDEVTTTASDLADRFTTAAENSERWAIGLRDLRAQADRYVETVENQPETHDPERLADLWREELRVLTDYRKAAEAARERDGLAPLADAYLAYIAANVKFAEEAIALLEDGKTDEYNRRLNEVFGGDDPFGFQEAVADATEPAISRGVTAELAELRSAAADLTVAIQAAATDVTPTESPRAG